MPNWVQKSLRDLIEIKHGYAFKGVYFCEDPPGDVLLTPGNFAIGGGFQWGKQKYYRNGPVPHEYVLRPGDLLVTMTDLSKGADTLGYAAVVPDSKNFLLHNQRLGKVIRKNESIDLGYLHWLLRSPDYRYEILASYTGSTVKHTSPKKILAYEFACPPLQEQQQIAKVLDSLDHKIDLNRRMNETLEAMARAIFKDWFIDFGPTRAKAEGRAPYLDPELWELFPDALDEQDKPVGWVQGILADVAESPRRGVNPCDVSEDTPYIGLEHMPRRSIALSEWEGAGKVKSNKTQFHRGEILFGKLRPYFHKVGIAPLDGICSTDIVVAVPRAPDWGTFTLACLSSDEFVDYTNRTSTGTKMPRTSWKTMAQYKMCLPPEQVACAFQVITQPLLDRLSANVHETTALAQTRDLLLPKLMSGEIRLRDAEEAIEAFA